ncbi:sulfurtransferase [Microbacterium invictum]
MRVDELAAELTAGAPVRLLDVRWRLDLPEGRIDYLGGHLPGAVFVDLERELTRRGRPEEGSHPLPDIADLTAAARRWGLNDGDRVVVYDDNDSVPAARAWWLLRRHGIDTRVLDGGFRAWVRAGLRLERSDRAVRPGDIELTPPASDDIATLDHAALVPRHGVLIDVRAPRHYRGSDPGFDPVSGHIPGAVNLPTATHITPDGLLRSPEEIRSAAAVVGIHPDADVVVYCGSGVASMHTALAFDTAGLPVRVYVGSWSQWSRSPGRPVAVGPTPAELIGAV